MDGKFALADKSEYDSSSKLAEIIEIIYIIYNIESMARLLIVNYAIFTCERIDKITMQYMSLILMIDN